MTDGYIWEDLGVTDKEARELIRYHREQVSRLQRQASDHAKRASEIEGLLTPRTVVYSGGRA